MKIIDNGIEYTDGRDDTEPGTVARPVALLNRGDRVTLGDATGPDGEQVDGLTLTVFDLSIEPLTVRVFPRQSDITAGAPRWVEVSCLAWASVLPAPLAADAARRLQ